MTVTTSTPAPAATEENQPTQAPAQVALPDEANSGVDARAQLRPDQVGTVADPATAALPRPGSLPTPAQQAAAAKDKVLTSQAAIDMAREALGEITEPLSVGAYVAARCDDTRLVTHLFDCTLAGYRGWRWAVTLTRPPRARSASVTELELLPGEDAILAPAWIPWADRLQPGDVSRSDRLPKRETDERLEPGWEATGEDEGDAAGTDALDFGRARVLSPEGMQRAAQRWYDGEHGPGAEGVRKAHAACSTCGFFIPMNGPLRNVFGICANEWAEDDGRVVSMDHGCGAHSETDLPDQGPDWPVTPSRLDEAAMEPIGTDGTSIRDGKSQEEMLAEAAAEEAESAGSLESSEGEISDAEPVQSAPKKRTRTRRSSKKGVAKAAPAETGEETAEAQAEPAQDSEPGQDTAEESAEAAPAEAVPVEAADADKLARSRKRRTSTRKPRDKAEVPASDKPAAAESDKPAEASLLDETEARHAAALDAVAELAAATHPVERPAGSVPTTLEELEAQLPFGR